MVYLFKVFARIYQCNVYGFNLYRHGFQFLVSGALSLYIVTKVLKTLPIGTAYAVWTGIGALGAVIVGVILFKEPVTLVRLFFVAMLLTGIIGLKLTSGQ